MFMGFIYVLWFITLWADLFLSFFIELESASPSLLILLYLYFCVAFLLSIFTFILALAEWVRCRKPMLMFIVSVCLLSVIGVIYIFSKVSGFIT